MKFIKLCEICGDEFVASRSTQKYCPECGKRPEQARIRFKKALRINKVHSGEYEKPVERVCKECGKKILTVYDRSFCNSQCRHS